MVTDESIAHRYLTAMATANGAAASALFTENGILDDYRGGHRAGRHVIKEFIDARGPRTVDLLSEVLQHGNRLTVYTHMDYADGRVKTVRFTFSIVDGHIEHLCNSDIEFVPSELLQPPVRLHPEVSEE
jgi:SnoaL-like domain